MMSRLSVLLVVLSLALGGCGRFTQRTEVTDWSTLPDPGYGAPSPGGDGSLLVETSAQAGDMGDVLAHEGRAVPTDARYYGSGAYLRLDSIGDDWWVMSAISIDGLDLANAPAGTYRTTSSTYGTGEEPSVWVTGCSGPSYGNYTYDGGASESEITIGDQEDGSRTLDFRAVFDTPAGRHETTGHVVYRTGEVPPSAYAPVPVSLSDASQDGDMGEIRGYAGEATEVRGDYYGTSSSIRLDSVGPGWWVMTALWIDGLDLRSAPAGTYVATSGVVDESGFSVSVTGCSGPSYGNYTFDAPAEQVEMTITENEDGSRDVELSALFSDGVSSQSARARFRYAFEGER